MMTFLRSQSQTVLVVVLGVIAVGFLFYGNAGNLLTSGAGRGNSDYGRIDGEELSVAELSEAVRNERNSLRLSGQQATSAEIAHVAWAHLLISREADKLHITVTDQEVVDYISKMTPFQKGGVFNLDLYHQQLGVLQNLLHVSPDAGVNAAAATQSLFENLVRNDIRESAVGEALFGTVRSSTHDINEEYAKVSGLTTVSYVVFDPKAMLAKVKVTPADIEAEYKANPTDPAYRTKEKRKVDFVLFNLTPEQAKLPDDQKKAARDALGQKALDFVLAFQPDPSAAPGNTPPPPEFMAEARKRGLNPATTDSFSADSAPADVPPSPAFNQAAFALSNESPVSKVVEMADGVAVLHLASIQPSDLLPLDQVKSYIEKKLLQTDAHQAAQVIAEIAGQQLKAALGRGTDFKTAATALKFKVETPPAFVPKTAGSDPTLQTLARTSVSLDANQVSGPVEIPGQDLTVLVHLDARAQPDPGGLADFEKQFRSTEDQQLKKFVTEDWVNWKSRQPGTRAPSELEAFGNVE